MNLMTTLQSQESAPEPLLPESGLNVSGLLVTLTLVSVAIAVGLRFFRPAMPPRVIAAICASAAAILLVAVVPWG